MAEQASPADADEKGDSAEGDAAPPVPKILNDRFYLYECLGRGSFGEVWHGMDGKDDKLVAVKLELKQEGPNAEPGTLAHEYDVMHLLKTPAKRYGFADVFYFGREAQYVYLVMEYLGRSLKEYQERQGTLNLETTVFLVPQILQRLEYLHSKGLVHRDIKPENFVMGREAKDSICHLIDFGLSERYYCHGRHLPQTRDTLTGTARYASINAHSYSQSRRDDLVAAGHMFIYLRTGTLPWIGLDADSDEEELKLILRMKKKVKVEELMKGVHVPDMAAHEFGQYLTAVRKLKYKERPDYRALHELFDGLRHKLDHKCEMCPGIPLSSLEFSKELFRNSEDEPDGEYGELEQPDDVEEPGCCSCFTFSKAVPGSKE